MFKSSPDNKSLAIMGILVLGMAFPTYQTLAGEPVAGVENVVAVVMPEKRSPASIPAAPTLHFESVDIGCKKNVDQIKANGQYLQLKGQFCRSRELAILNKSNGFTASVFELGSERYQTDMIQLKNGDNELIFQYRNHKGQLQEHKVQVKNVHRF